MFIEIDGGFFNRIEGNPIPPDGEFALFTGKLYGCVPMVFVTLFIIRIINMFCHVFCPPFFGYRFRFEATSKQGLKFSHFRIQPYHGRLSDPDKLSGKNKIFFSKRLTTCLKADLSVTIYRLSPLARLPVGRQKTKIRYFSSFNPAISGTQRAQPANLKHDMLFFRQAII